MKKGLIFVLFALVSIVSYSQLSWNAKVGMNMSNLSGDAIKDSKMKVGFNIGVGAEYQFTEMWSIQPSLMFTMKGAKGEDTEDTSLGDITVKGTFNPMYIQVPIMAAARFAIADNQNIVVKAGPYFAFGVAGKLKYDLSGEGYNALKDYVASAGENLDELLAEEGYGDQDVFKDEEKGGYGAKRFDFGIGVGVAYEINKFFIDLTGEFGLTNLYDFKDSDYSNPKNMNFSIGVGYKF